MSLPLRADPVPVSSQAIFRLAREHPVRCLCMIESHGGSPSDSSASLPKYDGLIRRLRLMQKSFATHNTIKSRGQAFIGRPNPHGRSSAPPRGAAFRPLHWKNGGWRFGWSAGFRTVKRPKCRAPTDLRCGGANGSLPAVCASRTAGFHLRYRRFPNRQAVQGSNAAACGAASRFGNLRDGRQGSLRHPKASSSRPLAAFEIRKCL
jgi:hypothetical protein